MTGRRPYRIDPEVAAARARLAGIESARKASPEERRARASAGGKATAQKARERRAAELEAQTGERVDPDSLRKPAKPEPSARALEYWLGVVDREQPDREWTSAEERRSAALLRAKQEAARIELNAARDRAAE